MNRMTEMMVPLIENALTRIVLPTDLVTGWDIEHGGVQTPQGMVAVMMTFLRGKSPLLGTPDLVSVDVRPIALVNYDQETADDIVRASMQAIREMRAAALRG